MTLGSKSRLRIPKILAVSALGIVAGCPGDDQGDTGNESGPSPTTTAGTTTGEESTTTATTAATETGAVDSSGGATDTGALPDCQANEDQTSCQATMSCVYLPELGGCIIDCTLVEDEATCLEEVGCEWYGDFCDFEPLA